VAEAPVDAVSAATAPSADASLAITVRGINSARGVIRLAICPANTGFPECKGHELRMASLPIANRQASIHFTGLPAGTYAIAVFHDANGNSKLDTFMGIPREGYGFSRNPPFRPRAPRFSEAALVVGGETSETISLRYLL
jgi:uncharacterized protein (DUF2141 family)